MNKISPLDFSSPQRLYIITLISQSD